MVVYLLVALLLFQLGCSGITQIPYSIDESKSDNEIRSLNYFGERLNSTIHFKNSFEVETYWLKMKDDKIYFLTDGLDDTTSVLIEKVQSIYFFDFWRGCLFGGISYIIFGTLLVGMSQLTSKKTGEASYVLFPAILSILPFAYGIYAFSDREFIFVPSESE
jgi:hypothetical protein